MESLVASAQACAAHSPTKLKVSVSYNHSTGILSYGAVINFEGHKHKTRQASDLKQVLSLQTSLLSLVDASAVDSHPR